MEASKRVARIALLVALCFSVGGLATQAEELEGAAASIEKRRYQALSESAADFARGIAAQRRGDLESSRLAYLEAIEKDEAFVEAMVNLARVHLDRDEFDAAATWLDRAEAQRSNYPAVSAARGLMALQMRDVSAAIGELSEARAAAPRDVEVLTNLAAALLLQGLEYEAIEVLTQAQDLDPHRAVSIYNLGIAYDRVGDQPRAAHHYERYLRLADPHASERAAVEARLSVLRGEQAENSDSIADEASSARGEKEG